MNRLILTLVLSFSAVGYAGAREDAVGQALDSVKDAQDEAEDATGACKRSLRDLEALSDKLSALKKSKAPSRGGFQATCTRNSECDSNTCFVGQGNLGYCTKMCDSFSECPSFWECKRAANAPQAICMQDH